IAGAQPNLATSCISSTRLVNRYWNITSTSPVISPTNYNATATFLNPSDIIGSATTSLFIPSIYNGSTWLLPSIGTRTSTSTQATAIQSYGSLVIGEPSAAVGVTIVGPAMPVCNGSTINFTAIGINGGTAPGYNWNRISSGNTFAGQSFSSSYVTSTLLGGDLVRVVFSSSGTNCIFGNPATSNAIAVSYSNNGAWLGTVNNDWSNGGNWCGGVPPSSTSDISINSGTLFSPILTVAGFVQNFSIGVGATFNQLGNLNVYGNFSNSGTFTQSTTTSVNFSSSALQSVGGPINTSFYNINVVSAGGLNFTSPQTVYGTLNISNSTADVASNGNLIIGSNAAGTGRIGVLAAGNTITGNVTVQRYMSAKKAYRYFSSAISNGNLNQFGSQIWITGLSTANDLDAGTQVPSLYWYVETVTGSQNNGWRFNSRKSVPFDVGRGYNLFVNAKTSTVSQTSATATTSDVTLSQFGLINSGNITFPITYSTSVGTADGWNLIGNPYPSQVDFSNVGGWSLTNVLPAVTYFNPETILSDGINSATTGSFVTYSRGVACPGFNPNCLVVASQQGFWVRSTATGSSMTINENAKSSFSQKSYFRTEFDETASTINSMWVKVNSEFGSDYAAVKFTASSSVNYSESEDVLKMVNANINLSGITPGGKKVAINYLPIPSDSLEIPFQFTSTKNGNYEMGFEFLENTDFDSKWYLIDNYFNKSLAISSQSIYPFEVSADLNSKGNRFKLVVKNTGRIENVDVIDSVETVNELNSVTGLSDVSSDSFASVYPNPISGNILYVNIKNMKGDISLSLTDLMGMEVIKKVVSSGGEASTIKLEVSNLPASVYVLKVLNNSKSRVFKLSKN
ncbi:MAG: T9SS type A sorting domain-containing protein, partial [Cytophagales bacterium]